MTSKKANPSWSDVKASLVDMDQAGLLVLLQNLYAANKDNKVFLHARLGLGEDPIKPYKTTLERWLSPNVYKNQDYSVAKAKKAISDYKKAVGHPAGLAELMVYYCELAADFSQQFGVEDEGFFEALLRMFEQALKTTTSLATVQHADLHDRLDAVRNTCHHFGYGIGDEMDDLLAEYGVDD